MLDQQYFLPAVLVLYVLSGVLQPITLEVLNYHGSCEHSTMLFLLPTYLGMSMTYFSPSRENKNSASGLTRRNTPIVALLCALDILSQTLNLTGLVFAGSLIFTILYSSCTIWTAIFSYIVLGRSLHTMQWIAVVVIVLGLGLASAGSVNDGREVIIGSILIITGSIFHSLTYIISEKVMVHIDDPITPESLSYIMGFCGSIIYITWQLIYTVPNFDSLVMEQISSHNGNITIIIISFFLLILINFVHAYCFFHLLGSVGATTTGVLKGVQTSVVFILSHFAFCSLQSSQCFTIDKGISVIVVVLGVIGYSYFNTTPVRHTASTQYMDDTRVPYTKIQDLPY